MGWVEKIVKNKGKIEMRREGKEVGFQGGTYSLTTINIQHVFTWYSQKHILGKTSLYFPNKIHTN